MAAQTQWKRQYLVPALGGRMSISYDGFDYAGIDVLMRRHPGISNSDDEHLWQKLQFLERNGMNILNEQQ